MSDSLPGFNGERPDPICGVTHLGNGYRAYHPLLMRFTCPDDLSPFGAGGINPYAYCVGDPINRADPSGHVSAGSLFGILAGVIGGVILGVFTAGLALTATLAIDAAFTVAVTGAAMGIDHQRLSSMSGEDWGVVIGGSVLASVGGAVAGKVLGSLKGARGRPFGGLMMEGIATTSKTAETPVRSLRKELEIIRSIDGTDVAEELGAIVQRWGTTDLKSVINLYEATETISLREFNADEIFLHRSISARDIKWLNDEQQLIFNNRNASAHIAFMDFVKEGNTWKRMYKPMFAKDLPNGGISFIMTNTLSIKNPYGVDGGINIRSKLSDVFRLNGRVISDRTSPLLGAVFVEMPRNIGLPYV